MKHKMWSRLLSMVLAVMMITSIVPTSAFAEAASEIAASSQAVAEVVEQTEEVTLPEDTTTEEPAAETPAQEPAAETPAQEPAAETPAEEPASQARTYTVEAGDCLWNIAYEVYGTGTRWTVIYEANRDTIRDPGMIYIGQVLTIPAA